MCHGWLCRLSSAAISLSAVGHSNHCRRAGRDWLGGAGRAERLSEGPAINSFANGGSRLLRQQIVWSVLAMGAMFAVATVNYRRFAAAAPFIFAAVVVLLVTVYAFPTVNGAHRWIRLGGIGMQPSEFAKIAFILALASYLAHRDLAAGFTASLSPLAMAAAPVLLILREPDLGTSLVFVPVLLAMLFAAGARRRDLVRLGAAGLMLLPLLWSQMSHEQRSRITALWEQNGPREAATPDGFHLDQAKRMFALGSVWGSVARTDAEPGDDAVLSCRLPEPYTDSIFCVVSERFGLVGAGVLMCLFCALVYQCAHTAHAHRRSLRQIACRGCCGALCRGNVGQHRDANRPGADYGRFAAAGELRRQRISRARAGFGICDKRTTTPCRHHSVAAAIGNAALSAGRA